MKQLNEVARMQQLAGISLNENNEDILEFPIEITKEEDINPTTKKLRELGYKYSDGTLPGDNEDEENWPYKFLIEDEENKIISLEYIPGGPDYDYENEKYYDED